MAQVQTAPPPSVPWDNPFSHVTVTAAPTTDSSPQWIKDLDKKGWAIIPKAISEERADHYVKEATKWLEGFGYGYKHDDPSTWRKENLPRNNKGGLYSAYSVAHAQFMWDAKTEPGVVKIFEEIWGTDKLTVSFDGANFSVPLPKEQLEDGGAPWPHMDQSPLKPQLASIQGILNLLPNGPKDGGLTVVTGSTKYFNEIWEYFKDKQGPYDSHDHIKCNDEQMAWLAERGCYIEKPCLEPGDFIVWDSRTVHWGAAPEEQNHRMAIYTCYKPDAFLSDEARKKKIEYFHKGWCTSHDPCTFIAKASSTEDWNILFPYGKPTLSKKAQQAAGLIPYE